MLVQKYIFFDNFPKIKGYLTSITVKKYKVCTAINENVKSLAYNKGEKGICIKGYLL